MLNVNAHKNFTACGDTAAEMLLENVLAEMKERFAGSALSVYLGGSYGRGDGGVRLDRENGILYNDLDFFVFTRKVDKKAGVLLQEIAEKYEKLLKVDVDFSKVMSVKEIKRNAKRLMMQELKRGYRLVCGEDLLEEYLPEFPADKLPFSEACRLLLNRGMGLLLAGEKISLGSEEKDFILRNIYKAVLGAGDAILIAEGLYSWSLAGRLDVIGNSDMPEAWKEFYRDAAAFKSAPHREIKTDITVFWNSVRDFFQAAVLRCAGVKRHNDLQAGLYNRSYLAGELSVKNCIKYCIKSRTLPLEKLRYYKMPAVAVLAEKVYMTLSSMPEKIDRQSKLYQQWLIFN